MSRVRVSPTKGSWLLPVIPILELDTNAIIYLAAAGNLLFARSGDIVEVFNSNPRSRMAVTPLMVDCRVVGFDFQRDLTDLKVGSANNTLYCWSTFLNYKLRQP
jgi:hypothetical protein